MGALWSAILRGSGGLLSLPRRGSDTLLMEADRWGLWIPVGLGTGIALYFSLVQEPALWTGGVALAAAALLGWSQRHRPGMALLCVALAVTAAGFTAAQWRAALLRAPVITDAMIPTQVTGRVASADTLVGGKRVILERLRINRLPPDRTPERIRLTLRGQQPALEPGNWVTLRAGILPLPPPTAPGAFDFQRQSYFDGVGGIGFSLAAAEVIAQGGAEDDVEAIGLAIARLRQHMTERIYDAIGGASGAIAAALVTGERGAIPESVLDAMRDSGLAHLLAISGMNIGLVAGILFFVVRAGFALVPPIALRYPIKKWAAGIGIVGALGYTVISGGTVPAIRSFLMIALVLTAVLFDRRGISMRTMAWSAAIILLLMPESLIGASFQMSFAAVIALITVYEILSSRLRPRGEDMPGWLQRGLLYLGGIALTTLVAGAATAPFALYHFNRYAAYGLAANLIAIPLNSVWVMPWAVIGMLLMPFGLEGPAFRMMGWGIDGIIATAETVAGWSGAVTLLPAMPIWGLILTAAGGLWLCLWTRPWRLAGVALVAAGLASLLVVRPPDILIDGRGSLLGIRTADGGLALSGWRGDRFVQASWLRLAGQEEAPPYWPVAGTSPDGRLSCDALGCVYRAGGWTVALVQSPEALVEDCRLADVVVATVPVGRSCRGPTAIVDRFDLWRDGAHALWLSGGVVRVESVNGNRGRRPWVVRPAKSQSDGDGS